MRLTPRIKKAVGMWRRCFIGVDEKFCVYKTLMKLFLSVFNSNPIFFKKIWFNRLIHIKQSYPSAKDFQVIDELFHDTSEN